jgi:hypothetical protein
MSVARAQLSASATTVIANGAVKVVAVDGQLIPVQPDAHHDLDLLIGPKQSPELIGRCLLPSVVQQRDRISRPSWSEAVVNLKLKLRPNSTFWDLGFQNVDGPPETSRFRRQGLAICQSVTELPTWAIWLAVFLLPGIGYAVALIQGALTRKGAIEADNRGRREELMRQLRWAAELAVSDDPRKAQLGVDQLDALIESALLSEAEKSLVDAALLSSIHAPVAEIEATEKVGERTRVVQMDVEATEAAHLRLEHGNGAVTQDEEDVRGA